MNAPDYEFAWFTHGLGQKLHVRLTSLPSYTLCGRRIDRYESEKLREEIGLAGFGECKACHRSIAADQRELER